MREFECKICNKKFETGESLRQHNIAKHEKQAGEIKSKRNTKRYILLFLFILIIVIVSATFYIRSQKPGKYDDFARCLKEKGAVIYGNDFCQYTTKQLNMFGKSGIFLNYVRCIENEELCNSKNVKITPTWEINGQMYEGVQEFERLATVSGCGI